MAKLFQGDLFFHFTDFLVNCAALEDRAMKIVSYFARLIF
jgi:hypothetical protein